MRITQDDWISDREMLVAFAVSFVVWAAAIAGIVWWVISWT